MIKTQIALALVFLIVGRGAQATPEKITVFFLSEQKRAAVLHLLDHFEQWPKPVHVAESNFNCVPMGDGCFHPQLGYIEDKPAKLRPLPEDEPSSARELKTFNSTQTNLIECREGQYFDIFCGRAQEQLEGRSTKLELWFDVSSSLRKNDYSRDLEHCERRSFAEAIINRCSKRPIIAVYNTSLKEIGQLSQICNLTGGNNTDRTIDWIRGSRTEHLVMVTDTEEFNTQFRDFLARENATIYGIDDGNLVVEKLLGYVERISKTCQ